MRYRSTCPTAPLVLDIRIALFADATTAIVTPCAALSANEVFTESTVDRLENVFLTMDTGRHLEKNALVAFTGLNHFNLSNLHNHKGLGTVVFDWFEEHISSSSDSAAPGIHIHAPRCLLDGDGSELSVRGTMCLRACPMLL